jgi:hypothetical protein
LDSDEMAEAGFWYYPTGRPAVEPTTSASVEQRSVEQPRT